MLHLVLKPKRNVKVLVWKITEKLSTLERIYLTDNSKKRVDGMKSEIHKKGFLSVRHLLANLDYTDDDLFYTNDGKPHLKDGRRISITHSFNFSAIIISDNSVGIDIEKNRDKIMRIAHKFIGKEKNFTEPEMLVYKNEDAPGFIDKDLLKKEIIERLTKIWGAKESLYKIHPADGLSFKKHLIIEQFKINGVNTKGWIIKDNHYKVFKIRFKQIENFTLAFAYN